jgi:hypothetical protein
MRKLELRLNQLHTSANTLAWRLHHKITRVGGFSTWSFGLREILYSKHRVMKSIMHRRTLGMDVLYIEDRNRALREYKK